MFETMRELFEILNAAPPPPRLDRLRPEGAGDHPRRRGDGRADHRRRAQRRAPAHRGVHAGRQRDRRAASRRATTCRRSTASTSRRIRSRSRSSRSSSSTLGYSLGAPPNAVKPRHFQKLVEKIHGKPEEKPIAFLMLRTMQKARYDPENLGHFGLAASSYTHFTSPIRRYPGPRRPPHAARVAPAG